MISEHLPLQYERSNTATTKFILKTVTEHGVYLTQHPMVISEMKQITIFKVYEFWSELFDGHARDLIQIV